MNNRLSALEQYASEHDNHQYRLDINFHDPAYLDRLTIDLSDKHPQHIGLDLYAQPMTREKSHQADAKYADIRRFLAKVYKFLAGLVIIIGSRILRT